MPVLMQGAPHAGALDQVRTGLPIPSSTLTAVLPPQSRLTSPGGSFLLCQMGQSRSSRGCREGDDDGAHSGATANVARTSLCCRLSVTEPAFRASGLGGDAALQVSASPTQSPSHFLRGRQSPKADKMNSSAIC